MLICARIGCSCMLANSSFCTVWIFFSTSSISLLCELYFSLRSHLSAYKWPLLLFLADLQRLISTTTTTTNQTRSSSLAKAKRFCCSANSVGFRPSDDGIFHRNIAIHEASHIHTTHPNETKSEKKRREEKRSLIQLEQQQQLSSIACKANTLCEYSRRVYVHNCDCSSTLYAKRLCNHRHHHHHHHWYERPCFRLLLVIFWEHFSLLSNKRLYLYLSSSS